MVNSYSQLDYTDDIKNVNVFRTSDIIDIRPRVSDHTVSESSRSPLEFFGRAFDGSGQSAANPLASDDAILTDISYYQGRIDRVYLSKEGKFQVVYGNLSR